MMNNFTDFQLLLFKRLGIEPKIISRVEDVNEIVKLCSVVFTFENLDIVTKTYKQVLDKESIKQDILINGQGGLCYKLNGCLYYFLKDCGLNVYMTRGSVLNPRTHKKWSADQTHIITILIIDGNSYVVDIAFGCFIALQCIPIIENGNDDDGGGDVKVINSVTGLYKIEKRLNQVGVFNYNWCLEFKRHEGYQGLDAIDKIWNIGYAFNIKDGDNDDINNINQSDQFISNQLTHVQTLIINEINGEFNERLLATKVHQGSIITLTYTSLTITNCKTGDKNKIDFTTDNFNQFNNILKTHFNLKPLLNDPYI